MAIMQSCCCWRSVRRGSFACAIYSAIYFTVLALTTGSVLQRETQYLKGNRSLPESTSFLEPDTISPTTVRINMTLLVCSCCGVICSILLLYGLFKDQRVFLMPWIVTVIATCIVDVVHSLYLFVAVSTFDPTKVMLYTLSFFLLCLNVYSLLCVVSQYQEYTAGRGTAADDYEYRNATGFPTRLSSSSTMSHAIVLDIKEPSFLSRKEFLGSSLPPEGPTINIVAFPVEKSNYKMGLMKCPLKVPAVRYVTQPPTTTATSCLSSRRTVTNNETKTTATPTQSSTTGQNTHSLEKSPVVGRPPRKHVQFPDTAAECQKEKPESTVTVLVPKTESEAANATTSSSSRVKEPSSIDQNPQSQKNSRVRHT